MQHLRTLRLAVLASIFIAITAPSFSDLPLLDPIAKPGTRIGLHYQIGINVTVRGVDEADLCKVFIVDGQGMLQLRIGMEPIEKVSVLNLTTDEAVKKVKAAIKRFYRIEPTVKVGIVRIPRMRVEVFGASLRTGAFLLGVGSRLSDALTESGYFADANLARVQLERTDRDGSRVRIFADFRKALEEGAVDDALCNPLLENGDIVTLEIKPRVEERKTFGVHGEVKLPSFYAFKKGMTVRDALREGGGLLPTADTESVTIVRAGRGQFFKVDAARAIKGIETDNLELRPDDVVMVGKKDRGMRYSIAGAVAAPNTWDYKGDVTLTQALVAAGGILPDGDRKNLVLSRNMLHDPAHAGTVVIDYDKIAGGQMPDVKLEAGDVVTVITKRKQQSPLLQIGMFVLRRFLPF